MKKKTKAMAIPLLSGDEKQIVKADVRCVNEQYNIMGGIDVQVYMKSGAYFLSALSKAETEARING